MRCPSLRRVRSILRGCSRAWPARWRGRPISASPSGAGTGSKTNNYLTSNYPLSNLLAVSQLLFLVVTLVPGGNLRPELRIFRVTLLLLLPVEFAAWLAVADTVAPSAERTAAFIADFALCKSGS